MASTDKELLRLRDSIDNIDAALIHLLAERFKCTQTVGRYRPSTICRPPIPSARPSRSRGCGRSRRSRKLDPDFAEKFLNFIIKEVIHHHEAIRRARK